MELICHFPTEYHFFIKNNNFYTTRVLAKTAYNMKKNSRKSFS